MYLGNGVGICSIIMGSCGHKFWNQSMGGGGIWMRQEGPLENLSGGVILAMFAICLRRGAGLKMGQNGK